MRRRLAAACAVMMIAVMAMGCAGKTPAASTDGNDTETSVQEEEPAEEEPAELSEEEEQELYNLYIGLNNTMVGRLSSSLSKYFEYVVSSVDVKPESSLELGIYPATYSQAPPDISYIPVMLPVVLALYPVSVLYGSVTSAVVPYLLHSLLSLVYPQVGSFTEA